MPGLQAITKDEPFCFSENFAANTHEERISYSAAWVKINVLVRDGIGDCQRSVKRQPPRPVKRLIILLPLLVLVISAGVVGCSGSAAGSAPFGFGNTPATAQWLRRCPNIYWMPRQPSGRYDGASARDNIEQAARGQVARRSSYGTAPGGHVKLDPQMLRAIKTLAKEGYRFRVTSLAGASHSSKSRHYAGLAFDVDHLNGAKIGYSHPDWHRFLARCRELGATETLGPGDAGHSRHIHAAWPRK